MKKGHYSDINSPIASSPNPVKRARHTSASTPQYGNPSPSHDNQFKTNNKTVNTFASPIPGKLMSTNNISLTSPLPGRLSGEGMKRKSEDISPSETHDDDISQNSNEGSEQTSLLSTFFSPVLQYFGGAAGTGPREGEDMTGVAHGAVLDPHHPRQNQNQNNINDHGGIGKGADSKWETKDDRDMESEVASMPPQQHMHHQKQHHSSSSSSSSTTASSSHSHNNTNNSNAMSISQSSQSSTDGDDKMSEEEPDEEDTTHTTNTTNTTNTSNTSNTSNTTNNSDATTKSTAVMPIANNNTMDDDDLDEEDAQLQEEFNPYAFIKGLPAYSEVVPPHKPRPRLLPPQSHRPSRPTLVLDLDETLVHCSIDPIPNPDLTFKVDFNGTLYDVFVRKRPHFEEFLEHVSRRFEVVVFTASQQVYAETLLNILDPTKRWIHHRLYRDACLCVDGNYLKDLTVLGRDLSTTVLVDNSPHAFGYQIDNGIPIESWFDDDNDTELQKLSPFLDRLHSVKDVRTVLRAQFQLRAVVEAQVSN